MFTWRLAHNSLALRTNLAGRGMVIEDTSCPLCSRNAEDGGHLFIRCKEVKMVWHAMGIEAVRGDLERYNAVGDVMDHLWTLKMEDRVQIMYFW